MENNDNFDRIMEMNTEAERRKIAAMAMQGILVSAIMYDGCHQDPKIVARMACGYADALIAELDKKKG